MVNSNFYGLVRHVSFLFDTSRQGFPFSSQDAIHVRPTTIQSARAANLVCAAFHYRNELDQETLKPVYDVRQEKFHA